MSNLGVLNLGGDGIDVEGFQAFDRETSFSMILKGIL